MVMIPLDYLEKLKRLDEITKAPEVDSPRYALELSLRVLVFGK